MNRLLMSGSAMLMSFKASAKEIQKIISRLDVSPVEQTEIVEGDNAVVAAVQLPCRHYSTLAEYIVDMNLYVADAVNRRAGLICFPAFTGMLPLTFIPQFSSMLPVLQANPESGLPDTQKLGECLSYFSDFMFDVFYHTMSQLAALHRVYIMAGTVLFFEEDELCHRALLFNDQGDLAGSQDKIAPGRLESALRIDAASEIRVFDTPAGPVSILIGSDTDYFETARIARSMGAKVILNPTVFSRERTPMDVSEGLNLRVQENNLYGVQSVAVGLSGLGHELYGPCSIFAPKGIAARRNGVLAQSLGGNRPDILTALLEFEPLENIRSPYLHDRNPALMERYIDRLY